MTQDSGDFDPALLHRLSLVEMAEAIATGRISAVDATGHMLDRIDAQDPTHRAYQLVMHDQALRSAAALDAIAKDNGPMGPLHGVPIAIKDLIDYAGVPCTVGGIVHADTVPEVDAHVVRRLKGAGAVIIGKLKLTEGAFSQHHPAVQPPLNPWGADRWTGVSSSGSGVATAAQLCFGSLGTDTGGSIRFPSASCGLVGVKPTYGRVSRAGCFPLAESLDHIGPMTRTVADAARMLSVLSGHDPQDPNSLSDSDGNFEAELAAPVTGLRLGIDRAWISRGVDPDVVATVKAAAETLAGLGIELVDVTLPDSSELVRGWAITCGVEVALAHAATFPSRRGDYGPVLSALIDLGIRTTGLQYAQLERAREHHRRAMDAVFGEVDALIMPAMPFGVPTLASMDATPPKGSAEPITFTAPSDYSGHPSVTMPAGLDAEGLPRAFQLIGPYMGEGLLLRMAAAFERERGPMPAPPGV
ncbi:MAG TPA: amidase [Pseudomonadales bacterium]|nr:amidase [Pseudomonadales bacterium]